MSNSIKVPASFASIFKTKEFKQGWTEAKIGFPGQFDQHRSLNGGKNYERGRQFALLAPHITSLKDGNKLNRNALAQYRTLRITQDIL